MSEPKESFPSSDYVLQALTESMFLHVAPNFQAMSWVGAAIVADSLRRLAVRTSDRPLNVVFSAGRTPTQVYALLATAMRRHVDWSQVSLFQMDEYIDAPEAVEPFGQYLTRMVVEPLGIRDWHILQADAAASEGQWAEVITRQEQELASRGGIDLVVHGVGTNGHLGFNEPGSLPNSLGRVVQLSSSTRSAIGQSLPTQGVTMGLATLLAAEETVLLASGATKDRAVAATLEAPISIECPASWLRLSSRTAVIVDQAAAGCLQT